MHLIYYLGHRNMQKLMHSNVTFTRSHVVLSLSLVSSNHHLYDAPFLDDSQSKYSAKKI